MGDDVVMVVSDGDEVVMVALRKKKRAKFGRGGGEGVIIIPP
jgi:hypothetical protein